jgi:hypothetical protein
MDGGRVGEPPGETRDPQRQETVAIARGEIVPNASPTVSACTEGLQNLPRKRFFDFRVAGNRFYDASPRIRP